MVGRRAQQRVSRRPARRRAFVLIMVMVVLTSLALVSLHLAARCRMRLAEVSTAARTVQARWLAYAALQRARAALQSDTNATDGLHEPWAQLGAMMEVPLFSGPIEGLSRELRPFCSVTDEHAKLNVGLPSGLSQVASLGDWGEQVAPLLADWVDADQQRQPDGAESADYLDLPGYGYATKGKPLEMVEELLLLHGVTPEVFFGEDSNGNGLLDPFEDDGAATRPLDNLDGVLQRGPWSLLTCVGDGRLNVNTAPAEVLATLPLFDLQRASAVVAYRDNQQSTDDEEAVFASVEDLRQAIALQGWELDVLRPNVCTSSEDFRAVAIVYDADGRAVVRQEALLVREQGRCRIRYSCGW